MRCALAEKAAKTKLAQGAGALHDVLPSLRTEEMDAIHGARVASRRLRAVLIAHRGAIGKNEEKKLTKAVSQITSGLGKARELDVTIRLLDSRRASMSGAERYACTHTLNGLRALREQEHDAIAASAERISSSSFQKRLTSAVSSARPPKRCYLSEAKSELKRLRRDLWRAHKEWQQKQSEESLHGVRIAFKKFRYGCEQYSDLYGKRMKQLVKQLRDVQDDLGSWNDFRIARRYVSELAEGAEPMAASGIAPLADLLDEQAESHLVAYRQMAAEFFSNGQRDRVKRIIADVKAPCCGKRTKG